MDDNYQAETGISTYLTNLKHHVTYEITVQAYNEVGIGSKSKVIKITCCQKFNSPDLSVIDITIQ